MAAKLAIDGGKQVIDAKTVEPRPVLEAVLAP